MVSLADRLRRIAYENGDIDRYEPATAHIDPLDPAPTLHDLLQRELTADVVADLVAAQPPSPPPRGKDYTGQRSGYVTPQGWFYSQDTHRITWRCHCVCGRQLLLTSQQLAGRGKRTCGAELCARMLRQLLTYEQAAERLRQRKALQEKPSILKTTKVVNRGRAKGTYINPQRPSAPEGR